LVKNTKAESPHPSAELASEAGKLVVIDYLTKPAAPDNSERFIQETPHKLGSEQSEGHQYAKALSPNRR